MENTQTQNLLAREIFSFGFKASKKYFGYFALFLLITIVLSLIGKIPFVGWVINLVGSIYLSISFMAALIKISRGVTVELKDFFTWPKSGFKTLWTSIVAAVLIFVLTLVSYLPALPIFIALKNGASVGIVAVLSGIVFIAILLVIVHIMLRIMFAKYYSLENNTWAIKSIKASWKGTKGHTLDIFLFGIISVGVMILGILALFVGLLWAIPTVYVAQAFIYTKLFKALNSDSLNDGVNTSLEQLKNSVNAESKEEVVGETVEEKIEESTQNLEDKTDSAATE